ncbi:unnamed protein product [Dracunculus medinensis]|uniref:HintN domain-containing protein n=1 Tax=Dracunculus medinensis TaxID=318479 RepID=A0A0N4U8A8_DRAME|nr:unnamed protein product [Dracunculus medinensis]
MRKKLYTINLYGLQSKCCSFIGMKNAFPLRTIYLNAGESYAGAALWNDNRLIFYDLIKEVHSVVNSNKKVEYSIKISRMPCTTKTPEIGIDYNEEHMSLRSLMPLHSRDLPLSLQNVDEFTQKAMKMNRKSFKKPYFERRRKVPADNEYLYYEEEDDETAGKSFKANKKLISDDSLWPVGHKSKTNIHFAESQGFSKTWDNSDDDYEYELNINKGERSNVYNTDLEESYSSGKSFYLSPNYPFRFAQKDHKKADNDLLLPTLNFARNVQRRPKVHQALTYFGQQPNYLESLQCFSGDMTVKTLNGIKSLKNLTTNDRVLSTEESIISYSPILMFLHRLENEIAEFNLITTVGNKKLKITDYHLIYTNDCNLKDPLRLLYAKDLRKGQCLYSIESQSSFQPVKILSIERVKEIGIYAPLTNSGDIVVNSILTSCHSNVAMQTLQQTFFTLYRRVHAWIASAFDMPPHNDLPFGVSFLATIIESIVPL